VGIDSLHRLQQLIDVLPPQMQRADAQKSNALGEEGG
jgi:hypothetical protein